MMVRHGMNCVQRQLGTSRTGKCMIAGLVVAVSLGVANPAWAYVGPGAGLTAVGTILALLAAAGLLLVGFIWYPVKRMLRRRHPAAEPINDIDDKRETEPQK